MTFKMPHIPVIIGVICSGIAAIFQIIGVATDGWLNVLGFNVFGIWQSQGTVPDWFVAICAFAIIGLLKTWLNLFPDSLIAIRAFAVIGLLLVVASLATGVLQFFSDNAMLLTASMGLAIAAAGCILVEFAVFAAKFDSFGTFTDYNYGYSFALTVVSFVLCIVSGVFPVA